MGVWRVVAAVVVMVAVVVVVPGGGLQKGPGVSPSPAFQPSEECKHIRLAHPRHASEVQGEVLRQMCLRAAPHVEVTEIFKQFAVFLLHRDDFDASPKWYSGDAKDVLSDQYWDVNDVTVLNLSKYRWYVHGLPMWPLPHQAIANRTTSKRLSIKKKKPADWPNYGLATPIYLAAKAWRDPAWSVEEFFQQQKKNSPFKNHEEFHKLVKEVVKDVNGSRVESYSEWPFLKYSLQPMVASMTRRNKGICPDEFYMYFRLTPCYPSEAAHTACSQAASHAHRLLSAASCPATTVIVGFSEEYSENLRPL